jgi:tryptophan synthase alpha chain
VTALSKNRLVRAFADLSAAGEKALVPFLTAGYPDLEATGVLLRDFELRGVRVCELGVPFSDPIADGPTIQASYTEALAAGVDVAKIFQVVRDYRGAGGRMALVAMVSYSIVFRHGVEQYLRDAREAGFDATLVPDLPLVEAAMVESQAAACGLANVMLVAPTTPAARRLEIAKHSRGFIYYISVAGITGERDGLPDATIAAVAEFRKHTNMPVCIGFGISNAETVAAVCEVADGAIVGSAIIRRIAGAKDRRLKELVSEAGEFISELLRPIAQPR